MSGILGARNLKVISYIPFISPYVKSTPLRASDIISTGWGHKAVPFEQVINPPRKSCRIILWQIVQLGDMLPYFVHELPSHTPVFRVELLYSLPNSVTSRLPEQTYLLHTILRGFNISSIRNLIQSLTPKYVHRGCQSNSVREWVIKKISKNTICVQRTLLASGRVASALGISCALTVRQTFFLIPGAQQGSAYSGSALRSPVQRNLDGIHRVYTADMLCLKSTRSDLMNYPCESAPRVISIFSPDILYCHLNPQLCSQRSPEETAY